MIKISSQKRELTLDVSDPNEHGAVLGDKILLAELEGAFGHRHGFYAKHSSGFDLISALISRGIDYEVIEGADILGLPEQKVPEGAIS